MTDSDPTLQLPPYCVLDCEFHLKLGVNEPHDGSCKNNQFSCLCQIHLFRWASLQVPVAIIPGGHTPGPAPLTLTQPTRLTTPGLVQPNGAKSTKICKFFLKGWNFGYNQGWRDVSTPIGQLQRKQVQESKSKGFLRSKRSLQFTKVVSQGVNLQVPLLRVKQLSTYSQLL